MISFLLTALLAFTPADSTQRACARRDVYCIEMQRIANDARVKRAVAYMVRTDANATRELIDLTEIEAPPFKEAERARRYADMMRAAGADSVAIDEVGNVIALRRGTRRTRTVALAGHLDTVFPEGTDVRVKQRGDTLFAPGIADNTRGLIAMLQLLRGMNDARLRTEADVLFIGTVGEEGLGDLRGVKHLFRPGTRRIDAFIAVDGDSDETITNGAIGSRRYRVTFSGAGGHSWGSFGAPSAIHALGRAITLFDDAAAGFVAAGPTATYNVGRIGGGTSINAIAPSAWAEVDLRSENADRLMALDSLFHVAMVNALNEQNEMRLTGRELTLEARLIGARPGGTVPPSASLVQRAIAATRLLGLTPVLDASSTDANVPISRGVHSVTLSRGGTAGRSHTTEEWWVNTNGTRGLRRLLYILIADAGLPRS